MAEQLAYLAACCVAVLFSCGFPADERRAATCVAVALLGNWALCQWTYAPWPPQTLLHVHARDLWAIADLAFGLVAFTSGWSEREGRPLWWAGALWLSAMMQCCFHAVRDAGFIAGDDYVWWLDRILLTQIAVFLVGGAKGVSDWIGDRVGVWRLLAWPTQATAVRG